MHSSRIRRPLSAKGRLTRPCPGRTRAAPCSRRLTGAGKLGQVAGASRLCPAAAHFEPPERLAAYHGPRDSAVDVEVSDAQQPARFCDARGAAGIQPRREGILRAPCDFQRFLEAGCPMDRQDGSEKLFLHQTVARIAREKDCGRHEESAFGNAARRAQGLGAVAGIRDHPAEPLPGLFVDHRRELTPRFVGGSDDEAAGGLDKPP